MIFELKRDEKLVRIIFYPYHYDKKRNKLKRGSFQPPYNRDEVSVQRLLIVDVNFCKKLGKEISIKSNKKRYIGLALVIVKSVLKAGAFVKAPHSKNSLGHANIYYGYTIQRDEPIPVKMAVTINKIIDSCKFYLDPNPDVELWVGEKL